MNETRVYGTAVSVNEENIKSFWEQRAEMYKEKAKKEEEKEEER